MKWTKTSPCVLVLLLLSCGDEKTANQAPEIQSFSANPATIEVNRTSTLSVTASDLDGDALTYAYTVASGGGTLSGSDTASGKVFTAPATPGTSVVKVDVSDGQQSASKTVSITVNPHVNNEPLITKFEATPKVIDPKGTSTLRATATDADSDTLTYTYSLVSGLGTLAKATYTASSTPEKATFKVLVEDGNGGQATAQTTVTVKGWTAFGDKNLPKAGTWNANDPHLAFDSKNVPYLAVQNYKDNELGVFSYDSTGDKWKQITSSDGKLTSEASTEGRIFLHQDKPYVTYILSDSAKSITKNVVVRGGSSLTLVGGPQVTTTASTASRIVVSNTGDIIVAYSESASGAPYQGGVPAYATLGTSSSSWTTGYFEKSTTIGGKVELYEVSGTVYASYYIDSTYDLRIKKYQSGTGWVDVAASGAPAKVQNPALAFDGSDIYLVYTDQATGSEGRLSAAKYDGSSWKTLGSQGFSSGDVKYTEQVQAIYDDKVLYATCRNRRPDTLTGVGHKTRELYLYSFDGSSWDSGWKYQGDTKVDSATDQSGGGDDVTFARDANGDIYLTFHYRVGTNGADLQVKILKQYK